jgi:hypothetical protein
MQGFEDDEMMGSYLKKIRKGKKNKRRDSEDEEEGDLDPRQVVSEAVRA